MKIKWLPISAAVVVAACAACILIRSTHPSIRLVQDTDVPIRIHRSVIRETHYVFRGGLIADLSVRDAAMRLQAEGWHVRKYLPPKGFAILSCPRCGPKHEITLTTRPQGKSKPGRIVAGEHRPLFLEEVVIEYIKGIRVKE